MVFINLFAFLSVKDKINRVRHCSNQDGRLIFLQCRTRVRYVLEIQNNFDTVFFHSLGLDFYQQGFKHKHR